MIRLMISTASTLSPTVRDNQYALSSEGSEGEDTVTADLSTRIPVRSSIATKGIPARRRGQGNRPYRYFGSQSPWRSISSSHIATIRSTDSSAAVWGSSSAAW